MDSRANLEVLTYSFLPIIITIILTAVLNLNIAIATTAGVVIILVITKTKPTTFQKTLKNRAVWEALLAAFGALLLRNVTMASGASQITGVALANMNLRF